MITKAIVEKVLDPYSIRIRVPQIDRVTSSSVHTADEDLDVALVCTLPGCHPNIKPGDIVFVSLDDTDEDRAVILGYLYRTKETETYCDLVLSKLKVLNEAKLPLQTSIGNVSAANIACLEGMNDNIKKKLDLLESKVDMLWEKMQ